MLITRYQKVQTVTRLKGIYSQFTQAIRLSEDDNGDVSGWDLTEANWFDRYLASYLKVSKSKYKSVGDKDSFVYKQISGKRETGLAIINNASYGGSSMYQILNGATVITSNKWGSSETNRAMIIDINGVYTKPNQFGKDTFMFVLSNDFGFFSMGMHSSSECTVPVEGNPGRDYLKKGCYGYGCNKSGRGMWCAALIITDAWTISNDYPW